MTLSGKHVQENEKKNNIILFKDLKRRKEEEMPKKENSRGRKKKPELALTNREMDILSILWSSEKPLTVAEIVDASNGTLKANTVQAVVKLLLNRNLVEVCDIVYSGTVLCRNYRPTKDSRQVAAGNTSIEFQRFQSNITTSPLLASLLGNTQKKNLKDSDLTVLYDFLDDF